MPLVPTAASKVTDWKDKTAQWMSGGLVWNGPFLDAEASLVETKWCLFSFSFNVNSVSLFDIS